MAQKHAVLTGDLIGSTRAGRAAVDQSLDRISLLYGRAHGFSRSRGDGWQILLDHPGHGLWAMVRITADLRAQGLLETRIALGIDTVDHVDLADLSTASGAAFVASGRALSSQPKNSRLALAGAGVDRLHARLVAMIDERLQKMSVEQAQAAALAMETFPVRTQLDVADRLGISRQAVAARLNAAGFSSIIAATLDFSAVFGEGRDWDG